LILPRHLSYARSVDTGEELLFRLSIDMFCIAENGFFTKLNPAWTHHLGWSVEELCAKPFIEFVHPEDRERTLNAYRWASEGQEIRYFENRYLTKDGRYRWLQWNSHPFAGGDAAVARDVTDQKEHDFLLQQSQRQLQFLHFLVENTHDPVYVLSPRENYRMVYVNSAACSHFGLSREDLLSMTVPEFDPLYARPELDRFWDDLKKVRTKIFETQHRVHGERIAPVEVTASYFEFQGDEYITGTIRDISTRKHIEQNLERFAYAVSHDLQEPLRTIVSFLQLLQRKTAGTPELSEYIDFATEAAARMRQLIAALLDYSRVGTEKVHRTPIQLNDVVDLAHRNLLKTVADSNTTITRDDLPEALCDGVLIGQVFQNLFENAIKYKGNSPPRIHVSGQTLPTGWLISVKDNGIGIPPSEQHRIFEVFQRLHARHEYSGAGVGLATCKRVVNLHGGKIWVSSVPEEGSTFHFTIGKQPGR
jgi:PAS domain S-box-containing protein